MEKKYRNNRYLERLSDEDLLERAKNIFSNLLLVNNNTKIALPAISKSSSIMMMKWTHVLEEYEIRFGPYPNGINKEYLTEDIPNTTEEFIRDAVKEVQNSNLYGKYLFKYSRLKHLKNSYEKGEFRISPASFYKDPSMNYAIFDDELKFQTQIPDNKLTLKVFDAETGAEKGFLHPKENKITKSVPSDYYIFCLSSVLSPRLFWDFDKVNACLAIKNPRYFLNEFIKTFENKNPGYTGFYQNVNYIDPVLTNTINTDVYFSKHFKYSYQSEVRIVFLPPKVTHDIDYQSITIDNLKEISELIVL